MNIQARILARKMILTYLYEKYTAGYAASNEHILKEVSWITITQSALEQQNITNPQELAVLLRNHFSAENYDADMTYLIQHCFEKLAERGIDSEYIKAMAPAYEKFAPLLPDLVNKYATTFQYEDMDLIDRVIFLLWYAEFLLVWTPKEVVLNEAIELAKKYWDEGSPKLVNWILHKIITAEAEKKTA